jgi:superfamily II DNA or RNA helicase
LIIRRRAGDDERMDIDGGSCSGHKRKLVDDDACVEENDDDGEEEGGALMKASLDAALNTADVRDELRTTIVANVSSFNKLYATEDASKAAEMMRLVNDTRGRLQTLCVDRLDRAYGEGQKRAQVIAPPGFGKSRLAGMLIDRRFKKTNGQMIVAILVPTIELVKQFWRNLDPMVDSQSADHPFPSLRSVKFLRLCSAEDKERGDDDGATTDLIAALRVAADSMDRKDGRICPPRLVIISTYHSCQLLSDVLKEPLIRNAKGNAEDKEANWKLDLLICDEAHKTACKSESREAYWKMPLEDALVPARQRLFLTATPKIDLGSTEEEGENGDEGEVLHADMSDEAVYGPKVFELRLEHGIALRVLRDLEIRVVVVQGEGVKALLKDKDKDKATMAHLISQMSAVRHALDSIGNDPRKGFVFTSRIEEVDELYDSEQVGESLNGYQRFRYHSGESTKKNTAQLDALRDSNRALMFNCKSLGLGLDLPEAALVAILSGMTSWQALVQAVGRVLRQCASLIFQRAVLLLPILLVEGEEDEDAAAAAREADVSTKVRGKGAAPKRQKQKGPSKKKKQSTTTAGDLHQTSKIVKVLADELSWMSDDLRAIQAGRMGRRLSVQALDVKVTDAELKAVRDGVVSETLGRQMSKIRQLIADKIAALATLTEKPKTKGKKMPVPCASGGVAQVDLAVFWGNIRDHFGPEPVKAKTKLSEEEKKLLLAVGWVKLEAEKMAADAAKGTKVTAEKADKIAALATLPKKPIRGTPVPVPCTSGRVAQVDLASFWGSIRDNFKPEPVKVNTNNLSEDEKKLLLAVGWVKLEAEKMAADAAKETEVTAEKADKIAALAELSEKPRYQEKMPVPCASGGVAQVDLCVFWYSIRNNFGPEPDRAASKLSEEEKQTLLAKKWVKEDVQICEHKLLHSTCKECRVSKFCKHNRQRTQCKDCGGSGLCEHSRKRSDCKVCGGGGICEHARRRTACNDCTPKKKCSLCPKLTRIKSGLCASCNKEQKAKARSGDVE